jgi:hypothetical protein
LNGSSCRDLSPPHLLCNRISLRPPDLLDIASVTPRAEFFVTMLREKPLSPLVLRATRRAENLPPVRGEDFLAFVPLALAQSLRFGGDKFMGLYQETVHMAGTVSAERTTVFKLKIESHRTDMRLPGFALHERADSMTNLGGQFSDPGGG